MLRTAEQRERKRNTPIYARKTPKQSSALSVCRNEMIQETKEILAATKQTVCLSYFQTL